MLSCVVFLTILLSASYVLFLPCSFRNNPRIVKITSGMGAGKIASKLKEEGLIESRFRFKIAAFLYGRNLKAGDYEFSPSMNNWRLISAMKRGRVKVNKLTVPEGFSAKQIAALIGKLKLGDENKFLKLANDRDFAAKKGLTGRVLEGYLFPETYLLNNAVKEEEILSLMVFRFEKVMEKNGILKICEERKIKLYDLLRIASIIEKEAGVPAERPLVSAVFWNRIKRQMRLESCATVFYALGEKGNGKDHLTNRDLQIDSAYNTYQNYGLPPAPICNPGLASILAALNPAKVNYLYFVSKNDGTQEFSETLEQHNIARKKYLVKNGQKK